MEDLREMLKAGKGKDQSGQENLPEVGVGKWKEGDKRGQSYVSRLLVHMFIWLWWVDPGCKSGAHQATPLLSWTRGEKLQQIARELTKGQRDIHTSYHHKKNRLNPGK